MCQFVGLSKDNRFSPTNPGPAPEHEQALFDMIRTKNVPCTRPDHYGKEYGCRYDHDVVELQNFCDAPPLKPELHEAMRLVKDPGSLTFASYDVNDRFIRVELAIPTDPDFEASDCEVPDDDTWPRDERFEALLHECVHALLDQYACHECASYDSNVANAGHHGRAFHVLHSAVELRAWSLLGAGTCPPSFSEEFLSQWNQVRFLPSVHDLETWPEPDRQAQVLDRTRTKVMFFERQMGIEEIEKRIDLYGKDTTWHRYPATVYRARQSEELAGGRT
ncbi:hypothetical protein NX059_009615 [Plenodomus lindquistii]|nr:hypothetical protein NX059_009615 [Plenodomus lindquistii]